MKTVYHKNNTITYWSVFTQSWNRKVDSLPDCDLASMNTKERKQVRKHLGQPYQVPTMSTSLGIQKVKEELNSLLTIHLEAVNAGSHAADLLYIGLREAEKALESEWRLRGKPKNLDGHRQTLGLLAETVKESVIRHYAAPCGSTVMAAILILNLVQRTPLD